MENMDKLLIAKLIEWKREHQDDLKYLNQEKTLQLENFLKNPEALEKENLESAERLLEDLKRENGEKHKKIFEEIRLAMGDMRARLRQVPGYPNEPGPVLDNIFHIFDQWYSRLENCQLIDCLQNNFRIFKNRIYPELEARLYMLVNPQVYPLNLTEIIDSMPRLSFSSLEELEDLLALIRKAAEVKLKEGGKS